MLTWLICPSSFMESLSCQKNECFFNENLSFVNKDKAVINYLGFCKLLNSSWTQSQLQKNGTKPNLVSTKWIKNSFSKRSHNVIWNSITAELLKSYIHLFWTLDCSVSLGLTQRKWCKSSPINLQMTWKPVVPEPWEESSKETRLNATKCLVTVVQSIHHVCKAEGSGPGCGSNKIAQIIH